MSKKNKFDLTNSYSKLPKNFYEEKNPTPVKNPKLLKLNYNLCNFLNLDKKFLVPDLAIVPRLSSNSFLLIPMPVSNIVRVGSSPS